MIFHSLRMGFAAVVLGCLAMAGTARAGTVDLFGLPGNFNQGNFGTSLSFYYAQSVLADDANWSSLAFGVTDQEANSFNLIISEARPTSQSGPGFLPDATAILSHLVLDHLGGGLQIFDVDLNLPVASGSTYFFTLAAFGTTLTQATVRATEFNGSDKYTPGEFLFANDNAEFSNNLAWNSRFFNGEDLVFRANFASAIVAPPIASDAIVATPVPGALLLFGTAIGMLGFFICLRRRQSTPKRRPDGTYGNRTMRR